MLAIEVAAGIIFAVVILSLDWEKMLGEFLGIAGVTAAIMLALWGIAYLLLT